jgi:hypothetical protein
MDQKPIVLYLPMKGMAFDVIQDDLVHTLWKDAVAYSTVTKYARSAQFSGRKKPPFPKLQTWNPVLSMRQYSRFLPNFRFRFCFCFRFCLCESFRGGSVFRNPQCTVHRNRQRHFTQSLRFASRCDIFNGYPSFRRRNRSRFGLRWQSNYCRSSRCKGQSAKHAPVARHYHIERVVNLFVQ